MPRNVYHVDDLYVSMDAIPAEATKIIFKQNSFKNESSLIIDTFPNLDSLIFEDSSFANANLVEIKASQLENLSIGKYCFSGMEPESGLDRRLAEVGSFSFFRAFQRFRFLHSAIPFPWNRVFFSAYKNVPEKNQGGSGFAFWLLFQGCGA